MKITNQKEWRVTVTNVGVSFDIYCASGILNAQYELEQAHGYEKAGDILRLIGSNMRSKENLFTREYELVMKLQSEKLRRLIRRNADSLRIQLKSKRIRKQDEAPQAGADSSAPELCDGCKNTFKEDHAVCPDCSQLGGEA